jgi:hypothetical protein
VGRAGSSPRCRDSSVKTGKARRQVIFLREFDNGLGIGDMKMTFPQLCVLSS